MVDSQWSMVKCQLFPVHQFFRSSVFTFFRFYVLPFLRSSVFTLFVLRYSFYVIRFTLFVLRFTFYVICSPTVLIIHWKLKIGNWKLILSFSMCPFLWLTEWAHPKIPYGPPFTPYQTTLVRRSDFDSEILSFVLLCGSFGETFWITGDESWRI